MSLRYTFICTCVPDKNKNECSSVIKIWIVNDDIDLVTLWPKNHTYLLSSKCITVVECELYKTQYVAIPKMTVQAIRNNMYAELFVTMMVSVRPEIKVKIER